MMSLYNYTDTYPIHRGLVLQMGNLVVFSDASFEGSSSFLVSLEKKREERGEDREER